MDKNSELIERSKFIDKARSYNPQVNTDLLAKAFDYGIKKHTNQKRASGEAYFIHPIEVAGILVNMCLDSATIATALLHDTIEDTTATHKEITDLFGEEVANLVDGVTKFTKLERLSDKHEQAENFKKFLLATAGDVRVLLVKLADRLHNMRTLEHLTSKEKRDRICEETLTLYAPLAGRMGMQELREELENLSFRYLHPHAYKTVRSRLRPLVSEQGDVFHNIADEIKRKFAQFGIDADVSWRMKKPWSIWKKMQQHSISLEQISDLMGFRIIVKDSADCYRALGVVHTTWQNVPNRFRDYISTPKPNGYQSIHSVVNGPKQQRIELQIRTQLMHERAEYGIAAHWKYKNTNNSDAIELEGGAGDWLREIVEMLSHGGSAQEFLEHTKMEMLDGYLFCFTKKGRLIVLPRASAVLDFAYAVHTDIGNSCAGAKVNGMAVSLRQILLDGDEVEVIRNDKAKPLPAWEGIAKTGKARSAIRRSLRDQQKQAHQALGWDILNSIFKTRQKNLEKPLLERALVATDQENVDDLIENVGKGVLSANNIFDIVYPQKEKLKKRWLVRDLFGRRRFRVNRAKLDTKNAEAKIPIRGQPSGLAMKFAHNHFPVPGDDIIGILIDGKGVIIYPLNARALGEFEKRNKSNRWINLEWHIENDEAVFLSRIVVELAHEIGALATVSALIAEYGSNIDYLVLIRNDDNFRTLQMDIEVRDLLHVKKIIMALQGLSAVHTVHRQTEPVENDKN